jgi:hypothetical protein
LSVRLFRLASVSAAETRHGASVQGGNSRSKRVAAE